MAKNRQWLLAQRPPGDFDESAFKFTEAPVPTPKDGEVLVHNIWLSLDPYMRGRMRDVTRGSRRPRRQGSGGLSKTSSDFRVPTCPEA